MIISSEVQGVLTKISVSNEEALFDFTTEVCLRAYDYALGRIVIWDKENSDILANWIFELESVFKNQLVTDEITKDLP